MPRRILIATLGLVLALGGAEVALRLWPESPPIPRPERGALPAGLPVLAGLPDLLKPNQRGIFRGELFETNSLGIRDRDYDIPRPHGVFRIVITGGSTTMGSRVPEEVTYAARIEDVLSGEVEPRYEVVNVGIAGANIAASMGRLARHGLAYEPDLIVYGFSVTDIRIRDAYRRSVVPAKPRHRSGSALVDAVRAGLHEIDQFRHAPGTYAAEIHANYFDNTTAWEAYLAELDRLAAMAAERNVCVLVLLHTHPISLHGLHPYGDVYARVTEAAESRGMTVAASFDLYDGEDPRSLWVAPPRDHHANERAHALLTRALRRGLAALPPSCWNGPPPGL